MMKFRSKLLTYLAGCLRRVAIKGNCRALGEKKLHYYICTNTLNTQRRRTDAANDYGFLRSAALSIPPRSGNRATTILASEDR